MLEDLASGQNPTLVKDRVGAAIKEQDARNEARDIQVGQTSTVCFKCGQARHSHKKCGETNKLGEEPTQTGVATYSIQQPTRGYPALDKGKRTVECYSCLLASW